MSDEIQVTTPGSAPASIPGTVQPAAPAPAVAPTNPVSANGVETVDMSVKVPVHAKALADGVGAFAKMMKSTLKDGFDFSKDFEPIFASVMKDLIPAVKNFASIGDEIKGDPTGTIVAFLLTVEDVLKS